MDIWNAKLLLWPFLKRIHKYSFLSTAVIDLIFRHNGKILYLTAIMIGQKLGPEGYLECKIVLLRTLGLVGL